MNGMYGEKGKPIKGLCSSQPLKKKRVDSVVNTWRKARPKRRNQKESKTYDSKIERKGRWLEALRIQAHAGVGVEIHQSDFSQQIRITPLL